MWFWVLFWVWFFVLLRNATTECWGPLLEDATLLHADGATDGTFSELTIMFLHPLYSRSYRNAWGGGKSKKKTKIKTKTKSTQKHRLKNKEKDTGKTKNQKTISALLIKKRKRTNKRIQNRQPENRRCPTQGFALVTLRSDAAPVCGVGDPRCPPSTLAVPFSCSKTAPSAALCSQSRKKSLLRAAEAVYLSGGGDTKRRAANIGARFSPSRTAPRSRCAFAAPHGGAEVALGQRSGFG